MSDILIRGMEMPKPGRYEAVVIVLDKSTAEIAISPTEDDIGYWKEYPLVPVPQHGRLIDSDALKARVQKLQEWLWDKLTDASVGIVTADDVRYRIAEESEEFIDDAPTIIPADKERAE